MTVTFVAGPFYNPQTATLTISDNAAGSPQSLPAHRHGHRSGPAVQRNQSELRHG